MILSADEIQKIERKITQIESLTSAEFRIVIAKNAWFGIKQKAQRLFKKHGLHNTTERNAVMILLVENDKQILIYGDKAINEKCGQTFWMNACEEMIGQFKQREIANGLIVGLHILCDALVKHFPGVNQKDEISNEIIFEK